MSNSLSNTTRGEFIDIVYALYYRAELLDFSF